MRKEANGFKKDKYFPIFPQVITGNWNVVQIQCKFCDGYIQF